MRNLFGMLIFLLAGLATFSAKADLVVYEPFAYPVGNSLDGIDGAPVRILTFLNRRRRCR
jgi:hypothetical protein